MADYMSMNTLKFLLHHVHKLKDVLATERYQDYDTDAVNMLLQSTKDWADRDFYPIFREMDEKAVYFKDGEIISHPQLKKIMEFAGANGYIGSIFDYEDGGSQMPHMVHLAVNHILESANNHIPGYIGLTSGAAHLILSFGSKTLSELYVPNMIAGKWGGTMALTEPQAGSSLSDITTSAKPTDSEYYLITGQKVFISGGDHQATDNIIHLMLARIEGAPAGTKGISLFVVPKFRITDHDSFESNDVITAGDFQKLGQRGYSTVHLSMGEKNDCRGWLVGEANIGLKYMFQMMNGARIDVGLTATSTATAAYYASLQYAHERPQGRKLSKTGKKNVDSSPTLIINHPDVRRMLLFQKAVTQGALSLLIYCSKLSDLYHTGEGEEKEAYLDLLELLTPIAKTFPSEMGIESVSNGLQVLGGYGYCMDFPLQQYYRDVRIMAIYEGTTGIQSLDLLGRKATIKHGKAMSLLTREIRDSIQKASNLKNLQPYAEQLKMQLDESVSVFKYLLSFAMKGNYERFLADATVFMELLSTIVIAWQWLEIATCSAKAMDEEDKNFKSDFYSSHIHTMKFYFKYELPKTFGLKITLMNPETLTIVEDKEYIQ